VLRASTVDAARGAGLRDVGTLTPGAWADFVVLERNPLVDILNTRAIHSVWIGGTPLHVLHAYM
jgi:imidazolonepropionase-like amidohydrolase